MTDHDHADDLTAEVGTRVREAVDEIKPRLRGWLHAAVWPLALAALVVLVVRSPGSSLKWGVAAFMVSALLLFGVSAIYHTGSWSPRAHAMLRRFDHANIFVLIAGSYTPFALLLLTQGEATVLLTLVWVGAAVGVYFRVFWVSAPRWLYVPVYLAMGWAAIFWMGDFVRAASTAVLVLMVTGGLLYSAGGVVYGFRRPNPFPRWFGFHEVFHSLTIAAFASHYVGISIAAYSLR